jgi:hypothetical protein
MISTRVGSGIEREAWESGSWWVAVVLRLAEVTEGCVGNVVDGGGGIGAREGEGAEVDGVKALIESRRASRRSLLVVRRWTISAMTAALVSRRRKDACIAVKVDVREAARTSESTRNW